MLATHAVQPAARKGVEYRDLLRYLPHRFPFLLVDRITEYEPHRWARGIKNVSSSEALLVPPQNPYYPPGLIIESIGQLAIALFNISRNADAPADIVLGALSDVVLERKVRRGCRLRLYAEVVSELDNGFVFAGEASVDGDRVLSLGSLIAMEKPVSDS